MKLPDPVGYQWLNTANYRRKLPIGANVNEFKKLYTEAQVKELLAQADKDFSDGMIVVHLQVADQMRKRYEPVLKMALDALDHACGDRCNAEYNPCHARLAADTIRKLLK